MLGLTLASGGPGGPTLSYLGPVSEETPLGDVATEVIFENDRVRVWENRLAPGERSAPHRHDLDYLIIDLEGDRIAAEPIAGADEGETRRYIEAPVRPGNVVFLVRGMTETAVNVGTTPYRTILIELKD